ncbi:MAG: ribonuclease HI [Francisellaceae bacterium]|jgi:ribonuclease HI
MKKVIIYSRGSCDTSTREGVFSIKLEYMGESKGFTGSRSNTTTNRCIIQGCIEGAKKLKEPCEIEFITSTKMGISKQTKGKGVNKDLISELISLLDSNEHEYYFTVVEGQGDWLNSEIANATVNNT